MFNKKYIPAKVFLCVIFLFMFLALSAAILRKADIILHAESDIDWEKLYPFQENADIILNNRSKLSRYEKFHKYITDKLEKYTTEKMSNYIKIVEMARRYEDFVNWNMSSVFAYNSVIKLKDGHLTGFLPSRDITPIINSTVDFAKFCAERNIDFAYFQAPYKICKYDDADITGSLDFSNVLADDFLNGLTAAGVKNYDFRKMLHDEGKNHHDAFYITDHHWKFETGFWAAQHVLRILREDFNWPVDENILNAENFEFDTYYDCFLGSQGKKLTLVRAKPENFTFIYPKIPTNFTLDIASRNFHGSGDFMILCNKRSFSSLENKEFRDYYNATFKLGIRHIKNNIVQNNKKILILHDSFCHCLSPYLSMGVKHIDTIETWTKSFNGSIKTYVEREKPDLVLVIHTPSNLYPNSAAFDFR